jgi:Phosphotransferase enzyme family
MNFSPFSRDRDRPLEYYVMVLHASEARVLLVPEGAGWTLPHFTPAVTDFRRVRHINEHMRAQYGLESVVQRCVAHRDDPVNASSFRVYVLKNRRATTPLPRGGQWYSAAELDHVPLTMPEHRALMRRWLQASPAATVSALQAPWVRQGWFDEAAAWIQAQLAQQHIQVLGPLVQERVWALSCVMRVETSIGEVYFKAVPPFMTQESVAMQEVSRQYPDLLPAPLAVDTGRGWMVMPDFGGDSLLRVPDPSRWQAVLRRCAHMHMEQARAVEEWLARGIPDRRLPRMVQLTEPLMTLAARLLASSPPGLSEAEVADLHALPLRLQLRCAKLASYGIPPTLIHGDLGGNILVHGERYTLFDWTDVCIAHPFFELTTIIDTVFDDSVLPHETPVRTPLRDAYLEPWTAYEPMERLVEAFEVSRPLGALHQAMSYMWILMNVAEDARWELERGLVMWLRHVLPSQQPEG